MLFRASAPGSLMLMGEYAVLQGRTALVAAVDKRIQVSLQPRADQRIEIDSPGFGSWSTDRDSLSISPPFTFVTAVLARFREKLPSGCRLEIHSEFSDKWGLGSSAAVTVATLTVLSAWLDFPLTPESLLAEGRAIIRSVQGLGSGADVAASVNGGIVAYRSEPLEVEKFPLAFPLTVLYSGAKTPTVIAVKKVQTFFADFPAVFNALCEGIEACVKEAIAALREKDWLRMGKSMLVQQGLMRALGVSTLPLEERLTLLQDQPSILGAKISGSGFGDCVLALGEAELSNPDRLAVTISQRGVDLEVLPT